MSRSGCTPPFAGGPIQRFYPDAQKSTYRERSCEKANFAKIAGEFLRKFASKTLRGPDQEG